MVSKTGKQYWINRIPYDQVVNVNPNGLPCTINNPLAVTNVGSSNNIDLAAGLLTGYSVIHKFGRNPNVGNSPETIWQHGGVYSYLSAPSTVYVSSNAPLVDNPTGTGAQTVTVLGLDVNYNDVTETLPVNDTQGSVEFLRVYRAFVATAGSIGTNDGNVLIATAPNGGGTVLADIGTIGSGTTYGLGQTQLALYTIPAHCTGYLSHLTMGLGSYNDSGTILLLTREFGTGTAFRTRDIMDIPGGSHHRNYSVPIKLPAKTDIEMRALCSTGTAVSASFEIILKENNI